MRFPIIAFLASATCLCPLHAEPRVWKSADGAQSFSGEYVSHTERQVTIRRSDGKVFTLEVARLNEADKSWLAAKQAGGEGGPEAPPDPKVVFDTLCFGDSHDTVTKKLKESKLVEAGMDESYHGRTGLNGTYRTRQKIGGLHCDLYFDWTPGGSLNEISLRTQGVGSDAYESRLKENWVQLGELLTALHGKPVQAGPFPGSSSLKNDLFLASHLWRLQAGGSALLGTSMQSGLCMVVVRFTKERINPVGGPNVGP